MIDLEWVLAYLSLGAVVGFFAGLFGIGGGLLLVPVLLLLFDKQHFPTEHNLHLALGIPWPRSCLLRWPACVNITNMAR